MRTAVAAVRTRWILLAVALLGITYRLTIGVDLSDESYYVTYIDGWLKDGLSRSRNLVLHQTAELVVFPFAWLYMLVTGGERGLVLFLRVVFMVMSGTAAFCCYRLIRLIRSEPVAFCTSLFVFSFVPFSLPAPSYNTIGMQAMLCALCLFGSAVLSTTETYAAWAAMALSGFAWMVAIIAYPTLALVLLAVFGLGALLMRGPKARLILFRSAVICATWQAIGACLLAWVYGGTRLLEIFRFTSSAMRVADGLAAKLDASVGLLGQHPGFLALCVASIAVGFLPRALGRQRDLSLVVCLMIAGIVLAARAAGPVLYSGGHDIVLLLALSGMGGALPHGRGDAPVIRVIYAGGLLAGLLTAATATNGLFNFAIGGLPAAVLGLVLLLPRAASRRMLAAQCAMLLTVAMATGAQAFARIYGEPVNPLLGSAVRIEGGVFAGLLTSPDQASFVAKATLLLSSVPRSDKTMVVLGRLPGIYLLADLSPDALSTWDFSQQYGSLPPQADATMRAFYRDFRNLPDIIAVVTDPWTRPPPAWAADLLTHYVQIRSLVVARWSLVLYEQCIDDTCPRPSVSPAAG